MVTMGMELSQRADCYPLVATTRTAKGGKAVSKYIDVDVFIKSFREALPGLKAQGVPALTPEVYAYVRGGEAISEDLTKFTAADVVEVVRCRECVHWKPIGSKAGNSFSDMEYIGGCEFTTYCRRESDFCSYGERKGAAD